MTPALTRRVVFLGGSIVSLDWAPGVVVAIAGSVLAFWRGAAVSEAVADEKVRALAAEMSRGESQHNLDLGRLETQQREFQGDIHRELREFESNAHTDFRETLDKMNLVMMEMKVLAAEQGAFNKIATKTLESLNRKIEENSAVVSRHDTDIALLKRDR